MRLVKVGKFDTPVYVTSPPQDTHRVFVVQQNGLVREVKDGKVQARPFLDIRSRVLDLEEQGLFSIAFAPDYATTHLLYAFFTTKDGKAAHHGVPCHLARSGGRRLGTGRARRG